jgi:hypothetical protein
MKTTTSTQDANEASTPTQYEARLSVCEGRLEFSRSDHGLSVTREFAHKILDDWFDRLRKSRDMSGQAKVL